MVYCFLSEKRKRDVLSDFFSEMEGNISYMFFCKLETTFLVDSPLCLSLCLS